MSAVELLGIEPLELQFPFELKKQISCSIHLTNKTDEHVAFKFSNEYANTVDVVKLRVVYVSPPRPPSPVQERSEESSSPRPCVSENGNMTTSQFTAATETPAVERKEKSSEEPTLISRLTAEKNMAIKQNNKLLEELELARREMMSKAQGSFSFKLLVIVASLDHRPRLAKVKSSSPIISLSDRRRMAVPLLVLMVGKAKLLACCGGQANFHYLRALLLAFMMRLPMAAFMPISLPRIALSLRGLLLRLSGLLFRGTPAEIGQRLRRASWVLRNRVIDNGRSIMAEEDGETMLALSMSSL